MIKRSAEAIIYGLAPGDAPGWPIEFLSPDKIYILYGPDGIREPPDPDQYTDDNQMANKRAQIQGGLVETLPRS